MTRENAINSFKFSNKQAKIRLKVEKMRMNMGEIRELEFYIERDDMAIKALEQEPVWIPVSKRLPEESGEYLVSVIDDLYENGDYKATGIGWFAHKKDYAIVQSEWRELGVGEKVIAWMPLPEPYKSDGRTNIVEVK